MQTESLDIVKNIPPRFCRSITQCVNIILNVGVPNLVAIVLFGSCSRGEIRGMSDIDIAVVTKDVLTDRCIRGMLSDELEFLDGNLSADVVFLSEKTWKNGDMRLHRDIQREGIILWEGGNITDEQVQLSLRGKK